MSTKINFSGRFRRDDGQVVIEQPLAFSEMVHVAQRQQLLISSTTTGTSVPIMGGQGQFRTLCLKSNRPFYISYGSSITQCRSFFLGQVAWNTVVLFGSVPGTRVDMIIGYAGSAI